MNHTLSRRLTAGLLAGLLLLATTACGKEPTEFSSVPTTTTTTTTTTTAPKLGLNLLTGEEDMKTKNDRPVGFVVSDESSSLVQLGIESADMYFEAETEAGIPRILAIYSSIDRIPNAIGPVRSARPHFVKMAKALDMIYCHIGGSENGLNTIRQLGVNDLGNAYEINSVLRNSSNFSWNRSAFTKEKVLAATKRAGYKKTTSTASPFKFGEKAGTTVANTLVVKISESYDMAFTYNNSTGLYEKHRNALSTPVHKTHTGGPIAVSNVIVMFDQRTVDPLDANRCDFTLNSGSGLMVSGGTSRNIQWKRTNSQLTYYESDGVTPLTVATGKTFICLASNTLRGRTTVN